MLKSPPITQMRPANRLYTSNDELGDSMSESQALATSKVLKEPAAISTPRSGSPEVRKVVEDVIADIRVRGDVAVREYSEKFDHWAP